MSKIEWTDGTWPTECTVPPQAEIRRLADALAAKYGADAAALAESWMAMIGDIATDCDVEVGELHIGALTLGLHETLFTLPDDVRRGGYTHCAEMMLERANMAITPDHDHKH